MGKTNKILLLLFGIFLLIDLCLGWRYFSLSESQKRISTVQIPTARIPSEEPKLTPTPLLPPKDKLLSPLIAGIQHHKVEDGDVYELVGWVTEANEQEREIVVGQTGVSLPHKVIVSSEAIIRLASVDEKGNLFHQPKTFADLIPGKVRVNILCKEADCLQAEIVTIIEQAN